MPHIVIGTFSALFLIFWKGCKEEMKETIISNGCNNNVINHTNILTISIYITYSVFLLLPLPNVLSVPFESNLIGMT